MVSRQMDLWLLPEQGCPGLERRLAVGVAGWRLFEEGCGGGVRCVCVCERAVNLSSCLLETMWLQDFFNLFFMNLQTFSKNMFSLCHYG